MTKITLIVWLSTFLLFASLTDAQDYSLTGAAVRVGPSTYRLVLPEDSNEKEFLQDCVRLKELGCTYERASRRLSR